MGVLEEFLGIPLVCIEVRPDSGGRFTRSDVDTELAIFHAELRDYGYELGKGQ